jgi:hypothetical protein
MDNYETARRIMERSSPPNCVAVYIPSFFNILFPFFFLSKAYLPNGTEMQNLNVFRCYTCRTQNPRYFVEDFAEQIVYVFIF